MTDVKGLLEKYGLDLDKATWVLRRGNESVRVMHHWAIERIAVKADIHFELPNVLRAERDEAVMIVAGRMASKMEWACGEAAVGVNYKVTGNQSAYVYAMAEKRAKDRVVLKLIDLHGEVYAEDEPDEREVKQEAKQEKPAPIDVEKIKDQIDAAKSAAEIASLMKSLGPQTSTLPPERQQEVRLYAQERWHNFKALDTPKGRNGKPLENASDRVKEDAGGFGANKTPDDLLNDFKDELRYCHTRDEVQAIVESYRDAVMALTPPDRNIAEGIRKERLKSIQSGGG